MTIGVPLERTRQADAAAGASSASGPAALVSAVITFHREGELAVPTLHSIERVRRHAEAHGLRVEWVMTLDRADAATAAAVMHHPAVRGTDTLLRVDFGDLSSCRNHAVEHAHGEFVATLDGDDLFSENWIVAAIDAIRAYGPATIAHPQWMIAFGAWNAYWEQLDQTDPRFRPETLVSFNHWNACALARRDVFRACPYAVSRVGEHGFGFEDWHWNCETIARGCVHRVIPRTFRLERRKATGSLNLAHQGAAAILRPSAFFDSL